MKIITHQVDGVWVRFPGTPQLDLMQIHKALNEGTWNGNDLRKYGLRAAVPFRAPDGKVTVGDERFEDDGRQQVFDVEDAPEPEPVIPDVVSSRQFKLGLLAAGLLDQVEAWVATQDRAVQIAYHNSATFVRSEPMMQQGFTDLGFTEEQIDAFFVQAGAI